MLSISICAGTDNRSNESLSVKRSTTKWPLMIINMQLSFILSRAKIDLRLEWRPRDENKLADALTNGDFSGVSMSRRIDLKFSDLPLDMVDRLFQTKADFDANRALPRVVGSSLPSSKKFDKSPW